MADEVRARSGPIGSSGAVNATGLITSVSRRQNRLLTDLLAAAALVGGIRDLLAMASVWLTALDASRFGGDASLSLSDRLYLQTAGFGYSITMGGIDGPLPVWLGLIGVLILARATPPARPLSGRRLRASAAAAGAIMAALAVLNGAALQFWFFWQQATDNLSDWILGESDQWTILRPLFGAAFDVLILVAVAVLAVAWWPRRLRPAGADHEAEERESESWEVRTAHRVSPFERPPAEEPEHPSGPATEPPRLRSDGSSDSGYDEFRFRR